jgi:hypothetical protein
MNEMVGQGRTGSSMSDVGATVRASVPRGEVAGRKLHPDLLQILEIQVGRRVACRCARVLCSCAGTRGMYCLWHSSVRVLGRHACLWHTNRARLSLAVSGRLP